jgi:Glycosyl transferases group 1
VTRLLARARRVASPSTLRSLAREIGWRAGPAPAAPAPSWKLPQDLSRLTLLWPDRYRQLDQTAWVEPLRLGFERIVDVRRAPLFEDRPDLPPGALPFALEAGGRRLDVVVDYSDYADRRDPVLDDFGVVFKMQYLQGGYGSDRYVPGGFVPNGMALYRYLPRLRALADGATRTAGAYGRFGADKAGALRRTAVRLLGEQTAFSFRGGIGRVRYLESLAEAARAQVCIDLPGNGPLCFRLVEYLAVGCAVVSPRHECRLHVPLEEGRQIVFCEPDLSDLVDVVGGLVRDPARLASLRHEARLYFDRFLDYRQLSRYYLATCLERL